MSYIRAMIKRDKGIRMTVGCRAKLKKGAHWTKTFAGFEPGRHMIPTKRSETSFSVIVLPKGFTGKLTEDIKLVSDEVAWVEEDELELVDMDLNANLAFIDWYDEVKEDECPDCGQSVITGKEKCPECGFSWE